MGEYHTIYILIFQNTIKMLNDLSVLEDRILYELKKTIEDNSILNEIEHVFKLFNRETNKLAIFLDYLFSMSEEKFVFVIDEWDYMFLITYIQLKKEMIS